MNLTTKNFTTLVSEWAAVVQASVAAARPTLVLSFTKGAILRALAESQASVSLWLQGLILKLLTATRLSTSSGVDVDTWIADFGLTRLPAASPTGNVTFSRATPTNPAVVPVGAIVQSADGAFTFTVTADTTNSAYSPTAAKGLPGYTIPAQVASLQVPVTCTVPGSAGNVQAGGVTIIQTGISGVDTVTNAAAFTNGFNAETDVAVRVRFLLYIASLARGTEGAIGFAIVSTRQGLQYQIWEPGIGGFTILTVYVDDGSGAIPSDVLAGAAAAAQSYRAAGVQMAVLAATTVAASVVMTITTASGYYHPSVVAQVSGALQLYINGLGLGNTLSYTRLAQVAFDASPGVTDTTFTLNGGTSDLVPAAGKTIKVGSLIVS